MEQEHPVHIKIDEARQVIATVLEAEMKKVNQSGMAINPFVFAEALIFEASSLIKQSIADSVSEDGQTASSPKAADLLATILGETEALEATYTNFHESVQPNEASVLLAMSHSMLEVTHALNHEIEDNMDQSILANKVNPFTSKAPSGQQEEILKNFFNNLNE